MRTYEKCTMVLRSKTAPGCAIFFGLYVLSKARIYGFRGAHNLHPDAMILNDVMMEVASKLNGQYEVFQIASNG